MTTRFAPRAKMIHLHDLAPGTGDMPLCATCARLNTQDDEQ